jgi:NAD-dependent SIR2 family protein deacetylase
VHADQYDEIRRFVANNDKLMVITGAGCSQASGIPTYRDHSGRWLRSEPIQHGDFATRHSARQRYWARSMAGWPTIECAQPNAAHYHLAELERRGKVSLLVTQNVDGLHQSAGHERVIDLHGRLDQVVCLTCGKRSSRATLQNRLQSLNPALPDFSDIAPDGDADLLMDYATIEVPACLRCDGILKPDVVFYGGSVDRKLVQQIYDAQTKVDGLLVVGSSMMVFSAYRYVRKAAALATPIACINAGTTRADELYAVKVSATCDRVLQALVETVN